MKCHIRREKSGSRAPGLPGCPSVLKVWFRFCSALKFAKHGLQDEPAGICGICLQLQALRFPTAGSGEPRTLLSVQPCAGKGAQSRHESELGSVLPLDMAFHCRCPTWSANACCLMKAPSLSLRGSPRGGGSSAEPLNSSAAPPQ